MVSIVAHPYDWSIQDESTDEGHVAIHAWCLDRESNPYLIRVEDFDPWIYVELPIFVNRTLKRWTDSDIEIIQHWLHAKMGEDFAPTEVKFIQAKKLYYYRGDKTYPMLKVSFRSLKAMQRCSQILSRPQEIHQLGYLAFHVYEDNISLVRKLLTEQKCGISQWLQMQGVTPEDKISTLEREYIVPFQFIQPISNDKTRGWCTFPRILSFDIECFSNNHKAMPQKFVAKHVAFAISGIYQRLGRPKTRKKWVIVLGPCDDIPGVEVIRVKTEVELVNALSKLVMDLDPEIITGYNILGFDYPYLDARLKRKLKDWQPMGRLIGKAPVMKEKTWESSAYGHNTIAYVEMPGRLSIDLLPLVRRDYKLDKYDLGSVSMHFLKRTKHPMKAATMFQIYEDLQIATTAYEYALSLQPDPIKALLKEFVALSLQAHRENNSQLKVQAARKLYEAATTAGLETTYDVITLAIHYVQCLIEMSKVMEYCVEDSNLVIDLFEKLNIWISLIEMSNIVGVTPMELFTSGQQVRCLSLLYNLAHVMQFVIDKREIASVSFNGGFVFEPVPGLYDNVICLDFASLYPSIMQAFNICYTTLVPPEMHDLADAKCHVFDFNQESELADKTKKLDHYHYRWVKAEHREGLLPRLVRELVSERKAVKGQLATIVDDLGQYINPNPTMEDIITATILDKRQNALKVTANSFFGFLGAQEKGRLPLIEGAMCITAKGRELIGQVQQYVTQKYGAKMVYGDTDSAMIDLNITDPKECWPWGKRLSAEISGTKEQPGLFLSPLKMEFEKAMRLYIKGKKNYCYCLIAPDGTMKLDKKSIKKKGMGSARRDKCKWMSKALDSLLENFMQKKPFEQSVDMIVDTVDKLLKGQVPLEDLSFIRGLGANYKQQNYFMKIFAEEMAKQGKPCSPGDRLEYVVVIPSAERIAGVQKVLLGHKMRLLDSYKEELATGTFEKPDLLYYVENVLMNCIDEHIAAGYRSIVEKLEHIGYKPTTRHHFVSIASPVKMMLRLIHDKQDINFIKPWIREQLAALTIIPQYVRPIVQLNIIQTEPIQLV